jgi:hypothetical protein
MHLPTPQRRRMEERLLQHYHVGLAADGVADYPFDRCRADYRLCLLYSLFMTALVADALSGGDGGRFSRDALERCAAMLADQAFDDLLLA